MTRMQLAQTVGVQLGALSPNAHGDEVVASLEAMPPATTKKRRSSHS